jgi:hypothetical protein
MAQQKREAASKGRDRKYTILLLCGLLVGMICLSAIPTAWATPGQAPPQQSIPTPPKKKKKETPPPPTPCREAVPSECRLGAGDGSCNLCLPREGCIQINVHGLPWQVLFVITPMDPSSAPPPPPCYNLTTVAYILKMWDAPTDQPSKSVDPPYIHTICYNDADLAAAHGNPNNFVISYYDDAQQKWVDLVPTRIDEPNRHAMGDTGQTNRWWALFAKDPTCVLPGVLPETGQAGSPLFLQLFVVICVALVMLSIGAGLAYVARRRGSATHPEPWWKR